MSTVKPFKIFLLDMDQASSPKIVEILERAGYKPKWFYTKAELERAVEKEVPDLFLIEPFFSHDEGVKFLYTRKKDEILSKVPTIAITPNVDGYTIAQLQAIGVKDYIQKPLSAKLLLNLTKRILSKHTMKSHVFTSTETIEALAEIRFTKVSETSIQAETPVKLTDEVDGHYKVISPKLEEKGIVDHGLFLSRNTTFIADDGQFRAFFRMRGLREDVLQLIRAGRL